MHVGEVRRTHAFSCEVKIAFIIAHTSNNVVVLRVEFLLKTDGGYPRDAGVFFIHDGKPWEFPPL